MVSIKSEKYTPLLKGYLTYPPDNRIIALLLDEHFENVSVISFGNEQIEEYRISGSLASLIRLNGGNVKQKKIIRTRGKKELFGIPVEVRKINKKSKIEGIRIRVTGLDILELVKRMETIKSGFLEYKIKPKECLWDRTGSIK